MLSGIAAGFSSGAGIDKPFMYQLRSMLSLFWKYAVAVAVTYVYYYEYFDVRAYFTALAGFNIQPPYYFFLFFLQLMLLMPALKVWRRFCLSRKLSWLWDLMTLAVLALFSVFSIRYTCVLPVYGGGQYLFGGTYLPLYYLGMLLPQTGCFNRTKKQRVSIFFVSLAGWLVWWRGMRTDGIMVDRLLEPLFGSGMNPPSFRLTVFSLLTLFLLYSLFSLLAECGASAAKVVVSAFSWLGRYTFEIFLYHWLIRDIVTTCLGAVLRPDTLLAWVCYFLPMLLLPPLSQDFLKKPLKLLKTAQPNSGSQTCKDSRRKPGLTRRRMRRIPKLHKI